MTLEQDFVVEEVIDLDIPGYEKGDWQYKPITAGEENEQADEYIIIEDGKTIQKLSEINKCKMRNLVKVPYDQPLIKKMINVDSAWADLNKDQRWQLLGKLKPIVFTKIIKAMNKIDGAEDDKKKG